MDLFSYLIRISLKKSKGRMFGNIGFYIQENYKSFQIDEKMI